jgi:hypothetical protein
MDIESLRSEAFIHWNGPPLHLGDNLGRKALLLLLLLLSIHNNNKRLLQSPVAMGTTPLLPRRRVPMQPSSWALSIKPHFLTSLLER